MSCEENNSLHHKLQCTTAAATTTAVTTTRRMATGNGVRIANQEINADFHKEIHQRYFAMTIGSIGMMVLMLIVILGCVKMCGSYVRREREALMSLQGAANHQRRLDNGQIP